MGKVKPPKSLATFDNLDSPYDIIANLKSYMGEDLKIIILKNGKYVDEFTTDTTGNYDEFKRDFFEGASDEQIFIPGKFGDSIAVYKADDVKRRRFKQIFKDSPNSNCVFVPMISAINRVLEEDMSPKTRKKYQQMLDQIMVESEFYANGVPEDELIPLSQRLGLRLELTDVLGNTTTDNGLSKNSKVNIKISNTRKNHVDHYTDDSITEITQEEMNAKYKQVKENREFYIIYNNTDTINSLKTLNGTFKVVNPNKSYFDYMNKQIRCSAIDALKFPELNSFIKSGRFIHSSMIQYKPFTADVRCWDMKNAYAKYRECPYYEGFPYILHQFRNTDQIQKIGLYEFVVDESTPLSRLLGLFTDTKCIRPSVEIKWWIANGLRVTITRGVWGSSVDLDMPREFVDKKLYNVWSGKLSASDNYRFTKHTFPADREFAEFVKTTYPNIKHWQHSKEAQVKVPNKHVNTNHHIYAFITAYTRINMLEQMKNIPIDEIYGVQLDAIFTTQKINSPIFREKDIKESESTGNFWYEDLQETYNFPDLHINENSLLAGQGGSGKTTSILENSGYMNVLYVVPNHTLGERSGKSYKTIHKLIGLGCEPLDYIPSVLLLDEITQYHEDMIKQTFQMYPHSLILLAGDIDNKQHYQCRGGYTNNYMPIYKNTLPIVSYNNDYRAKTDELKQMKLKLRQEMQRIYTDGGIEDTRLIRNYITSNYPVIALEDARPQAGDIFLFSTKKTQEKLTHQSHGVHEFQGQTIQAPTRIFITIDWFEYAMPYTAVSRATSHEQIIFVKA